jgi:uncharacterized protein (TIGR03437 family)
VLSTVCLLLAAASTSSTPAAAPTYTIQTITGGTPVTGATPGTLRQPAGVLLGVQGDIFYSDALAHVVRRIDSSGSVSTIAGTGVAGFSGDGGPATAAQLNQPYGLAADSSGDLFIADLGNARVRVITSDGTIRTFAGGGLQLPGSSGGAIATDVQLTQPRNIAAGFDGSVYISDFGAHQVYRISQGILMLFAGTGVEGSSGDEGPAAQAALSYPAGVAADLNGTVYIADSGNNAVRKVTGGIISIAGTLKRPTGVAVDFYGKVYIAGADTVGQLGNPSLTPASGASDIAVDLVGNAAFVTATQIERADVSGKVRVVTGSAGPEAGAGSGGSKPTAVVQPTGLAINNAGDVFIADAKANVVWKLSSAGTLTIAAGDGDPKTLGAPASVAVDAAGNVYVTDTGNNRLVSVGAGGKITTVVDQLNAPAYVFADARGLLIADTGNNRVLAIGAAGAVSATTPVDTPVAAVRDAAGNVYVSQRDAGQVVRLGVNGWTTPILLDAKTPAGLALDANGDLLVADSGHNTIRLVAPDGSYITIAGTGVAGYKGDGGPALSALLSAPSDVRIDSKGQVWIADSLNGAVRALAPVAGGGVEPPPSYSDGPFRVVSSATFQTGAIAAGEIVSIFGTGFDPQNTQVTFDGAPAFVFYMGAGQINALAPVTLTAGSPTNVSVIVDGASVGSVGVDVAAAAPGLFTFNSGTGQAAALNQDMSINGATNAAAAGSIVVLYATGEGAGNVSVSIGGQSADILYAGSAPGYVGLMQINTRVPKNTPSGAAPVVLGIGAAASQDGVTIQVK